MDISKSFLKQFLTSIVFIATFGFAQYGYGIDSFNYGLGSSNAWLLDAKITESGEKYICGWFKGNLTIDEHEARFYINGLTLGLEQIQN